ncbi:hypothetical protein BKA64DRAFT_647460 [Cadophora sp. MPI-SDFR-AT-0126]|nr:hypothetical protein BKA64DRAFT_647460 [Leotiomycetes sp. MPI-SDFR-AT-0126]
MPRSSLGVRSAFDFSYVTCRKWGNTSKLYKAIAQKLNDGLELQRVEKRDIENRDIEKREKKFLAMKKNIPPLPVQNFGHDRVTCPLCHEFLLFDFRATKFMERSLVMKVMTLEAKTGALEVKLEWWERLEYLEEDFAKAEKSLRVPRPRDFPREMMRSREGLQQHRRERRAYNSIPKTRGNDKSLDQMLEARVQELLNKSLKSHVYYEGPPEACSQKGKAYGYDPKELCMQKEPKPGAGTKRPQKVEPQSRIPRR